MNLYPNAAEADRMAVVRARKAYVRDTMRRRLEFARTCEVWVAPEYDSIADGFGAFVCEVYPDGYTAYRTEQVDRRTGAPYGGPGLFGAERISWPVNAANIDHVRAEHEDMLRDCGYVRVL